MTENYNAETMVLPDIKTKEEHTSDTSFYLFAVHDGRIEKFRLDGTMRLGRMTNGNTPEIAVQNIFLSRSHGYFKVDGKQVRYTAEKTTNGISLNGKKLAEGITVVLNDGDELTIPTDRSVIKGNDIMLKCAFSSHNISLWDSMIEAQLDELTGLPGRRLFAEKFRILTKTGKGENWLFILDIDKFKMINDVYGHPAGDAALKKLAAELSKSEYNISFPARWGGDEFVGVVSGNAGSAVQTMERLNCELASRLINDSFSIIVSVGLCRIDPEINDLDRFVEAADKALYRSKKSETDKVSIFSQQR